MKIARLCLLWAICLALPGVPLVALYRADATYQEWPQPAQTKIPPRILVQTGSVLAQPAFVFVEKVMTRVDFLQYACAPIWHPVYRISFGILEVGYAGTLAFGFHLVRQAIRRRHR